MNLAPRSTLHALVPQGVGTPATESLLSYFCRLAVSHAVSTTDLAHFVVSQVQHDIREDFDWQQRNISGIGESAKNWAAWLSALTGVARLDLLTLTPWSGVLPHRGLAARRSHWCPQCFQDDQEAGRDPYFRLSWEVGPVEACHRHKVELVDTCPHCEKRHVRHNAGIVVPGWCSSCGGFLGAVDAAPASPKQLWVARQVEDMITSQATMDTLPEAGAIPTTLNTLILGLDGGQSAKFARRIGVAKSTAHAWLNQGNLPTLDAFLAMAAHSGFKLEQILRGDISGWIPSQADTQIAMPFDLISRQDRQPSRILDWDAIRMELGEMLKLPVPISVQEAGQRLGIDDRHLYLQANEQARALGARWLKYKASCRAANQEVVRNGLKAAMPILLDAGLPFNLTSFRQVVQSDLLNSAEGTFELIKQVRTDHQASLI